MAFFLESLKSITIDSRLISLIQNYDRYIGDMPPPARGCPTVGRVGVTGISVIVLFPALSYIVISQYPL
jgi:hypothetical protein